MRIDITPAGPVKPVHSVGQPPILGWADFSMFHYLKEAGVKFSRLHDVGGAFGKGIYVDIPNLFRDFDADPDDPASYDFAFTDRLLLALAENDVEPYFRLGVTIENACQIRAYRIFPPKDYLQWARICEGVIRHYTEGWADGLHLDITHWEIWNEPENEPDPMANCMWRGTFRQYLDLYETASKYLKRRFPNRMIGGYASCGFYAVTKSLNYELRRARYEYFLQSFHDFVDFVQERQCPLDFFSFHCYDVCENLPRQIEYARNTLDQAGFQNTELSLNEWKPSGDPIGSAAQAAHIAAALCILQNSPVHDAELYDARCGMGAYSPLFDPITYTPRKPYFALRAFNELYQRGQALAVSDLPDGLYAAAAKGPDDTALLLANRGAAPQPINLPSIRTARILDDTHDLDNIPIPTHIAPNSVLLLTIAP